MIVIVEYGVGNLRSVANMLKKAGAEVSVSADPSVVANADKLVLPGVGHFDHGMQMLRSSGLIETLNEFALEKKRPVLGICLGAQIFGKGSEEGTTEGLGWIDMECARFPDMANLRVPHMGWAEMRETQTCPLFKNRSDDSRYYFVHSYHMQCANTDNVIGESEHGITFTSAMRQGNIFGTQFHPEKSLRHGLAVMKSFNELTPDEVNA